MHTTLSAHPFRVRLPAGPLHGDGRAGQGVSPRAPGGHGRRRAGASSPSGSAAGSTWRERGWYSGDTHTHRTLAELPNVMLAEDLNVAFPLTRLGPRGVRPADRAPRGVVPRPRPRPDPGRRHAPDRAAEHRVRDLHGGQGGPHPGRVLRAEPQDAARPGRAAGRSRSPARAHREGALIELDKHNWPWSMALVPIMPVDLFELSNNHVWQTDFAFREFGEAPAAVHERGARREGLHRAGLDRVRLPELLRAARLRLPPAADGRDRLGRASRSRSASAGSTSSSTGASTRRAWLRGLDAGRSFVTTGPMLFVTLDGARPRAPLRAGRPGGPRVPPDGVRPSSAMPLERIEVVINGEVARTIKPANRETGRAYESPIDDGADARRHLLGRGPLFRESPRRSGPVRSQRAVPCRRGRPAVAAAQGGGRVPGPSGGGPDRPECRRPPPAGIDEYREALGIYRKLLETAR